MFGTIASPPAPIEVDADVLVRHIVGMACIHLHCARYHLREESRLSSLNDFEGAKIARQCARESRRQMFAVTSSLRCAIKGRTDQERAQAEATVRMGQATFWLGSCADETCGDCELPMWHHISYDGRGHLCPFGREFWTLARALTEQADRDGVWSAHTILREIAKRT